MPKQKTRLDPTRVNKRMVWQFSHTADEAAGDREPLTASR
jgi:hypothetical protein